MSRSKAHTAKKNVSQCAKFTKIENFNRPAWKRPLARWTIQQPAINDLSELIKSLTGADRARLRPREIKFDRKTRKLKAKISKAQRSALYWHKHTLSDEETRRRRFAGKIAHFSNYSQLWSSAGMEKKKYKHVV